MCLINAHFSPATTVYRAQFPLSFREINDDTKSDMKIVLPAVVLLIALSVWGASFLRNTSKIFVWCIFIRLWREGSGD